ncbi:hypothetical protein L916_07410 [Phytophthora nicotianae]|uniref:C2H2-type domain-containing protein n=1 Tax=Phytophthora nicotianae TaxID=4792 RepID=W2J5D0_PHYNI|nr:hypothetical protein L916_07410 [Phytophthora nicotianae]
MERLVHDLKTMETLCCTLDYPGISEEDLNKYIKDHGPLVNPVYGEVHGYWIDGDFFTPYRNVVPGCCELAPEIAVLLGANSGDLELWQRGQEPYAPLFVVEIDYLSGEDSQFIALDQKMRNQFFSHGVQLGWLIDPRPGSRKMFEYKLDEAGKMHRVDNEEWRDLDGGDVLPGFRVDKTDLEMVLDPDGYVPPDNDEIDMICPCRGCDERLRSLPESIGHLESHRAERERQKYLAKRAARKRIQLRL